MPADAAEAGDALLPPVDAGLDAEQDPNAYPAPHGPIPRIDYLGGPVLRNINVVTVTFQGDAWRADLEAFDDAIVAGGWWQAVVGEYDAGPGKSGGHAILADTVSNRAVNDDEIAPFLQAQILGGQLPAPDSSTVYLLYYPSTTDLFYPRGGAQSCVDFAGYHSEAQLALEGGSTTVAYGVVARCPGFGADTEKYVTIAASHILAEAATDPYPLSAPAYQMTTNDAWMTTGGSAFRNEVGDLCGIRRSTDAGGLAAQRIWSNRAAAASQPPCVPASPGEIWFGAAVRTELSLIGAHESYGYLVVARGKSRDAIVDVFSGAALPHDVTLYVGRDRGATDPTSLDLLPPGIDATLSLTTAHNGNAAHLTVSVAATVVPKDYPFVVRAVLDAQTYYDWPVLVHVK